MGQPVETSECVAVTSARNRLFFASWAAGTPDLFTTVAGTTVVAGYARSIHQNFSLTTNTPARTAHQPLLAIPVREAINALAVVAQLETFAIRARIRAIAVDADGGAGYTLLVYAFLSSRAIGHASRGRRIIGRAFPLRRTRKSGRTWRITPWNLGSACK